MPKPSFVIVTVDGTAYREGGPVYQVPGLTELGASDETLSRFVSTNSDVVLHYGNFTLRIPQARIEYIAERDNA
ncbi:hypothetical protein [Streptomyces vietnamensis]|uniref:hypothetical protein n=1 Tax=Streptomyces vietnamensis TaxID=362257 RepID=UPI003449BC0C